METADCISQESEQDNLKIIAWCARYMEPNKNQNRKQEFRKCTEKNKSGTADICGIVIFICESRWSPK